MSREEIKQIKVMEQFKRGEISQKTAAELMGKSVRTVRRKYTRYKTHGVPGLAHQSRGKKSNRKLSEDKRKAIVELAKTKYMNFGPTFMAEKLAENEHIKINRETLRLLLIDKELWKKQRKRVKHRQWREPKEHCGQMVQLDGSRHIWVSGSGTYWTLIKIIDDATGKVFARFYPSESYEHVADLTIRYIKTYGKPASIYTDCGGVFKVNKSNENNDYITQYERALGAIGIVLIHAYSPQAKGRVERSFQTDQDRLVKELSLRSVTSMEKANEYLESEYLKNHNAKYARQAKNPIDIHSPYQGKDLVDIFAIISTRRVANDWTIRYNNKILQIDSTRPVIVKPKDTITVHERLDGIIYLTIRSIPVTYKEIASKLIQKKDVDKPLLQIPYKPKIDHPWKRTRICY